MRVDLPVFMLCVVSGLGAAIAGTYDEHAHGSDDHHAVMAPFRLFDNVAVHTEDGYLVITSDGLAQHPMMQGITNWQQQVPVPQRYNGTNAWRVPLEPVVAEEPVSTQDHFLKGAIAIAVNGVPIFNAMNNRGEFAAEIGELDEWGGHSGRADDYHYHLPPVHLEDVVGEGQPIAYALDGFALYGKTDQPLDALLGRFTEDGGYRYHAVDEPPYFMAGIRGVVRVDDPARAPEDQIVPQPRSQSVRPGDYRPLRGAHITEFVRQGDDGFGLVYRVGDQQFRIDYAWDVDGHFAFLYTDADGETTEERSTRKALRQ